MLVRLQAPRFFVERDLVVLTANVQNSLPAEATARVRLQLGGDNAEIVPPGDPAAAGLLPAAFHPAEAETSVRVPKDGETRAVCRSTPCTRTGKFTCVASEASRASADIRTWSCPSRFT